MNCTLEFPISVSWLLALQKICLPFPQQMIGLTSLMHKDDTRTAMWVKACCDKSWFTPGIQLCLSHSGRAAQCWPSHGQCLLPEGAERQQPALPCCRALLVVLLLPLAFPPRAHLLIFLPPSHLMQSSSLVRLAAKHHF